MKKCKALLAMCLAIVMAFSVMAVGAGAEDAGEAKSRFDVRDSFLYAIDLSDQIQDTATINTGWLDLAVTFAAGETEYMSSAKFDPKQPGVVLLVDSLENGELFDTAVWLYNFNYTYTLSARNGNLYDDVATYSFTLQEVYEDVGQTKIEMLAPEIAVGEKDGDLVKTLTMNFKPEDMIRKPSLLDTVDLTKDITLEVVLFNKISLLYRAVPVSFTNNILTVALYDGEKAGVALNDLSYIIEGKEFILNGDCDFWINLPEGQFKGGSFVNAEQSFFYSGSEISGMPLINVLNVSIPAWLQRVSEKLFSNKVVSSILSKLIVLPTVLFLLPKMLRGLKKSFTAYGLDFYKFLFEELRSVNWIDVIKQFFTK